jgi:hypothetical protein
VDVKRFTDSLLDTCLVEDCRVVGAGPSQQNALWSWSIPLTDTCIRTVGYVCVIAEP